MVVGSAQEMEAARFDCVLVYKYEVSQFAFFVSTFLRVEIICMLTEAYCSPCAGVLPSSPLLHLYFGL